MHLNSETFHIMRILMHIININHVWNFFQLLFPQIFQFFFYWQQANINTVNSLPLQGWPTAKRMSQQLSLQLNNQHCPTQDWEKNWRIFIIPTPRSQLIFGPCWHMLKLLHVRSYKITMYLHSTTFTDACVITVKTMLNAYSETHSTSSMSI